MLLASSLLFDWDSFPEHIPSADVSWMLCIDVFPSTGFSGSVDPHAFSEQDSVVLMPILSGSECVSFSILFSETVSFSHSSLK